MGRHTPEQIVRNQQGAALAIDTTVAQNFRLTLQFGTAAATITATPKVALIEAL